MTNPMVKASSQIGIPFVAPFLLRRIIYISPVEKNIAQNKTSTEIHEIRDKRIDVKSRVCKKIEDEKSRCNQVTYLRDYVVQHCQKIMRIARHDERHKVLG
jgi:hypothetical protein